MFNNSSETAAGQGAGAASPYQPTWRKSSYSGGSNQCVEVASAPGGGTWMRDSKDPDGPVLRFTAAEWEAFVAGARDGEFGA